MRIVVDVLAARRSGAALTTVRELALTFPELRPDNEYLFALQSDVASVVESGPPQVTMLNPPARARSMPARVAWEHLVLPRRTRSFRPDVVFAPFNVAPTRWPRPAPDLVVVVSSLAPYSRTVRDMYPPHQRLRLEALRRLTNRTLRRADRVFVLSQQAFGLIDSELLQGKTELVREGPPALPPASVNQAQASEPYFVVVGDLYRYKGVEIALRALARISADRRPSLVVCGRQLEPAYMRTLEAECRELGLGSRVRFLGWIAHDRLLEIVRRAAACIAPSRFENLSRVPLEAMAVDTPVLASDVPAYREACGDAAAYFPVAAPEELAAYMHQVLGDDGLSADLVRRGRALLAGRQAADGPTQVLNTIDSLGRS